MTPTSTTQFRATQDNTIPPPERIHDRVWVVPISMPIWQPGPKYTLTYLLQDHAGRFHVIDPGWNSDANWDAFWTGAQLVRSNVEIASVIVTHLHPDHLGMASRLREATGATLVMHEREAWALEQPSMFRPADPVLWGVPEDRMGELWFDQDTSAYGETRPDVVFSGKFSRLRPPGLDIEVLHTPGHTAGSICLRLAADRLLFTGDHILPSIHPGLGLGGIFDRNALEEYFDSLGRVVGFDDHEILPGHHYRFSGLAERVAMTAAHHQRRSDEVARVLARHPGGSIFEVASTLTWTAGWERMRGFFLYSALSQTAMHVDHLRSTNQYSTTA